MTWCGGVWGLWRGWEVQTAKHPPWHLRPRGGPPRQQWWGPLGSVVGKGAHNHGASQQRCKETCDKEMQERLMQERDERERDDRARDARERDARATAGFLWAARLAFTSTCRSSQSSHCCRQAAYEGTGRGVWFRAVSCQRT